MRNIQLTDEELRQYIYDSDFSTKYNIKFSEALFIRYLNESDDITLEQIDMLADKYQLEIKPSSEVDTYSNFLKNIEFDKNAVYEVLISAKVNYHGRNHYISHGANLVDELEAKLIDFKKNHPNSKITLENDAQTYPKCYQNILANYQIAGLLWNDCVIMDQETSKKQLEKYSEIYGQEVVDIVKQHVKSIRKEQGFFGSYFTSK